MAALKKRMGAVYAKTTLKDDRKNEDVDRIVDAYSVTQTQHRVSASS